jgi:hypothetical protein
MYGYAEEVDKAIRAWGARTTDPYEAALQRSPGNVRIRRGQPDAVFRQD